MRLLIFIFVLFLQPDTIKQDTTVVIQKIEQSKKEQEAHKKLDEILERLKEIKEKRK